MASMGKSKFLNIASIAASRVDQIINALGRSKVGHVLTPELAAHLQNANPQLFAEVAAKGGIAQFVVPVAQAAVQNMEQIAQGTREQILARIGELVDATTEAAKKQTPSTFKKLLTTVKDVKVATGLVISGLATIVLINSLLPEENQSRTINNIANVVKSYFSDIKPAVDGDSPESKYESVIGIRKELKSALGEIIDKLSKQPSKEELDSYTLRRKYIEDELKVNDEALKFLKQENPSLVAADIEPDYTKQILLDPAQPVESPIEQPVIQTEEPVVAAEGAKGGAQQLFETDPLLFYLLNERPKNKKLKKAKLDAAIVKSMSKAGARKKKLNEWQKYVEKYAAEHNIAFLAALKPASIQRKKEMKKK